MRSIHHACALLALAAALVACKDEPATGAPTEDCATPGDEDHNGLADCSDPACAQRCGFCGDGRIDGGEECDDGNSTNDDDCLNTCKLNRCGDGFLDQQPPVVEICDDGNDIDLDSCSTRCTSFEPCGDGEITRDMNGRPIEECDDGNADYQDECITFGPGDPSYHCRRSRCGDGIVASHALPPFREECDGGPADHSSQVPVPSATCNIDCTRSVCGDGKVNSSANEQCDFGAGNADSGLCLTTCRIARCGDGKILAGVEQCDDGNLIAGDGCSALCRAEVCGNGILDPGEACDDGNTANGDGCSSACGFE